VDLDIVRSNVRLLKEYLGEKVHLMAVVKANAYGYGMIEIAQTSVSAGATWLGVASLDEALALRSKLTRDIPILVLGYVAPQHLFLASRYKITVTAISLEWIEEAARLIQHPVDFHLKIDTGLNRLGCKTLEEVESVMEIVTNHPYLNCSGIFTHFATSEDMKNTNYFHRQLKIFHQFLDHIPNHQTKLIHCANSGATLYHNEKPFFDMVRLGKAVMGPPNESLKHLLPMPLRHSLSLHSVLDLVKQLDANEKVGYLGEYITTDKQWIGTVPIGYADGWHQQFKTTNVLVDGQRVPIIGRIAMDQLIVALPKKYPIGTQVTFIGQQGNETIVADEVAQRANQPRSEVFSSLSDRLPRVYFQDGMIIKIRNSLLDSVNLS
jgi:alanine racemase